MYQDLSFMKIPLPEDVLKLKNYGDYAGAQKMIRYFLEHKEIPKALRKRLEIEQEIIGVMGADEYPYTYAEALEMMTSHLRDFKEEELQYLKEIGAADWIYIDGEVHFQRLFYDNLTQTRPDLAARVIVQNEELEKENAMKQKLLNGNVHYMKEHGGRTVHTRIRATIKAKKEFEEVGRKVSVHLPIPKVYEQVSNVQIHAANPEITFIAPEDAAQRTVYFETELQPNQEFMVEYSFDYHINYVELDPKRVAGEQHILHLQCDGAGGVAGGAEHVHGQIAHMDGAAFIVELNRLHRPHLVAELATVPSLWIVGLGDIDGQIGVDRQQIGHAQHMVKVAVGQQNELYVQVVLPDARQDLIGASAGIDHGGGVVRGFIGEQIAVGADHADLQRI